MVEPPQEVQGELVLVSENVLEADIVDRREASMERFDNVVSLKDSLMRNAKHLGKKDAAEITSSYMEGLSEGMQEGMGQSLNEVGNVLGHVG